jgi:hypothetical protein
MSSQVEKVHTASTLVSDVPEAVPTAIGIVAIEATGGILPDNYYKTWGFIGTVAGGVLGAWVINASFTNFLHLRYWF